MAIPTVTYTFSNATVADATEVNTNFSDLINALTDGTSDHSINTLTLTSTLTANGNVTLGNASGDTLTVNATPTFAAATTFSNTTTFNGAPTFNANVTLGAYDFTVNTDVFFVDASTGRVGLGTTSPDTDGLLEISSNSDDNIVGIVINDEDTTASSKTGYIFFKGGGSYQGRISCTDGVGLQLSGEAGFSLSPPVTIDPNGFVGIGTTSPTNKLHVNTSDTGTIALFQNTNSAGNVASFVGATTSSSDHILACFRGTSTSALLLRGDGELYYPRGYTRGFSGGRDVYVDAAGLIGYNTSAEKYKYNLRSFSVLENIEKARAVIFDAKDGSAIDQIGVIADDFVSWLPELVDYQDGEVETISYGKLAAVAFRACQELKAENDSLKARLDALESA